MYLKWGGKGFSSNWGGFLTEGGIGVVFGSSSILCIGEEYLKDSFSKFCTYKHFSNSSNS